MVEPIRALPSPAIERTRPRTRPPAVAPTGDHNGHDGHDGHDGHNRHGGHDHGAHAHARDAHAHEDDLRAWQTDPPDASPPYGPFAPGMDAHATDRLPLRALSAAGLVPARRRLAVGWWIALAAALAFFLAAIFAS
ncbi:MAG TPA: hypothetical protein VKB80_11675 [Kofleriaceae bacterium]|nr:hypothetical protein [Kofleriaceae bacterium]